MNLNLFNRPDEARSELDMKLDAQRAELENTMVRLGYEEIMRAGTNLTIALARTSPSMSSLTDTERQNRIDRIYMHRYSQLIWGRCRHLLTTYRQCFWRIGQARLSISEHLGCCCSGRCLHAIACRTGCDDCSPLHRRQ